MELLLLFTAVAQSFAISLGVGSSTLAIVNFFVAIADGKIDDTERKMMGVVYVVLRVAMVIILATTAIVAGTAYLTDSVSLVTWIQLLVVGVLFLNAVLMTVHVMPSTFGPAIQAGSWYTLGTVTALATVGALGFSFTTFVVSYITWLVLATGIVNGIMAWLRAERHNVVKD